MTSERPWSVPVRVADVPETGLHLELTADPGVRAAAARIAGVDAIPRLQAAFDVAREGAGLRVTGQVCATVNQTCVVTLEPLENLIAEPVRLDFAPGVGEGEAEAAAALADGAEPPEPLVGGVADLGVVAIEFLLLGIDPYPRKAGAAFSAPSAADEPANPFAALAALKKRPTSSG